MGTEIIGWDPRSRQIRSWTFNSDGSFGDGVWSKANDEWVVKTSQTLADGQAASGTFLVTLVDKNTLTMQLVGHEIEGIPQPTSEPVTISRVPESSDATATEPQSSIKPE